MLVYIQTLIAIALGVVSPITDFKNKKNEDLWREYIRVANGHKITAIWVKGHAGHPQNEACDSLARGEAQKYKKA